MNNQDLWQAALGEIEINLSRANFITWFKNTDIIDKKDGQAVIGVPNGFSKEWLSNKYQKLILRALRNISPEINEVSFSIYSVMPKTERESVKIFSGKSFISDEQLVFDEFETDKETNLNPKYRFNSFVVGSFNELAHAAASAVSQNLGSLYNPLFIYGGVGLGKTHLLQAIGNESSSAKKSVKYLTSEKFSSELVSSLREGTIEQFKDHYRKIDVLIIDDVQFLAGKEKTQEEFFHTFNALYQKNKQIIISSDRPPKAISTLEERLRSRFEGGMIADISFPDYETRLAIIKAKTEEKKISLPFDLLEYIASSIQKNIRELEGALNKIAAHSKLQGSPPTISQTAKILANITASPKRAVNYKNIIKAVSDFYDINTSDLTTKCRKKEVVWPRQVIMYLMREELKNSYPFIGEKLGGRDHTTVMYAYEKLSKELEKNESLQQEIGIIREKMYN